MFHVGLYFAPGHWIVKSPQEAAWAAWPLAAIVPWRLTVLFAVSGYASAAMIQRHAGLGAFLAERSKRLLIPLLFGMLVIIPPQDWVRLEVDGIDHSYLYYLTHDNFSFSDHGGTFFPNWEHLWFLPFLWTYTLLLTALLALIPIASPRLARAAGWLGTGGRLLYLPIALILCGMALLQKLHFYKLVDSVDYLPAFLFGAAYAHFAPLRAATARLFRAAWPLSLAALVLIWGSLANPTATPSTARELFDLTISAVMSWSMLIVMFHLADRLLNFDHRLRQPLAEAVFPAYIVHQTAIVVVGWYLVRWGVVGVPAFAVQLGAVLVACFAAWWLARGFPLAGLLLGMPHKRRKAPARQTQPAPQRVVDA